MTHKNLALVLGGGGASGNAWMIGIIAGLAEVGIDLAEAADLVIGTSSGATAAAQIRSGKPPAELLRSILAESGRRIEQSRDESTSPALATMFERMRSIGAAATSAAELRRAMGAFGLENDAKLGPGAAEKRKALVAARLVRREWPERPIIIVAVDAHTGELAAFDGESGVDLVDAVAASTAMPGLAPTHRINGERYINGGVRSAENADLAAGYANVIVLSPFGGRSGAVPEGQFEGLRKFTGMGLASEVDGLRNQGSRVEVITPDEDSRSAMGTNQMDPLNRIPAARAGFAQGKKEATRLPFL